AGSRRAADAARHRRRGDRIRAALLRLLTAASGTKRRSVAAQDLRQLSGAFRTCGRLLPVVSGAETDPVRQAVDIGSRFYGLMHLVRLVPVPRHPRKIGIRW